MTGPLQLFYTYEEIAEIFKVEVETVRNWKHAGHFKIIGYRRLGRWRKEAVVDADEVKKLIYKKYAEPFEARGAKKKEQRPEDG